jgi:hypothetical protein
MAHYRIYLICVADRIVELRHVTCATDADVLAIALPLLPAWPLVEIWDGTRRVVRLSTHSRNDGEYFRVNRSHGRYRGAGTPEGRRARRRVVA